MLEYIFKSILITSLIGTAITLFLTVIKPITRKFFSSRWNYYVWIVVLVAMIVPFRFTEPLTVQQNEVHTFYSPIQDFVQEEKAESGEEMISPSTQMFEKLKLLAESQMNTFAWMWFSVACILFLSKLIMYGVFLIKLKKCSDVISCPELHQFTDRKIITRVSDSFSSPLMVGVFKPMLLLPKTSMNDEQLNNVLSHEITHFRRKDILYKWFVCLVKCIHWFNPTIYYIDKQVNIECEISCDAEVVKDMSEEQQRRYIDTIITLLASAQKKPITVTTGMVSDKKTLQRRFTMIKKNMKISKKAIIISMILVLAVIGGTVFASGVLNGKLVDEPEDEIVLSKTDDKKIEVKTDTGKIIYDAESGDVVSSESEPKLVPDNQSEKTSNAQSTVDVDVNENEDVVLKKIEFDADIANNPVDGEVSMNFGKREHPITKEVKEHNGIDIKAPEGTDVVTSITGKVTDVGYDSEKGNYIVVENGNVKTLYAQLASTSVKKGDEVTAKQSIGTVGKTGNATGAHLHFEVMVDGKYVDPSAFIK